jgi:hypothetical protein
MLAIAMLCGRRIRFLVHLVGGDVAGGVDEG